MSFGCIFPSLPVSCSPNMQRRFPLFQSHLDLAHAYWTTLLRDGGWAIDSTCGGGRDTLKLARILSCREGSRVTGVDIQKEAIERTQALLDGEGPACAQVQDRKST